MICWLTWKMLLEINISPWLMINELLQLQDSTGDAKVAQEPMLDVEDQEVHASVEEVIEKRDEN